MAARHAWGVALATGGSGGHLFPAIAVAEALRHLAADVPVRLFATTDTRDMGLVPERWRDSFEFLPLPKPGTRNATRLRTLRMAPGAFQTARSALARFAQRGVVLGFGGYASVPTVLAARSLGWTVLLFEANAVPGRATRALAPFAHCVFLGFPGASFRLGSGVPHRVTGVPVRQEILDAARARQRIARGREPTTRILGILGGSQGAATLNDAAVSLTEALGEARLWIVHQTGQTDWERSRWAAAKETRRLLAPFFQNVGDIYAYSDALLMRAGAGSVAEAAASGTPAILIPYPAATDNHQVANAEEAARELGWTVIEERPRGCVDVNRLKGAVQQALDQENSPRCEFAELHASAARSVATETLRFAA